MTHAMPKLLIATALVAGLPGCALFSKHDPQIPRYFTPEYEDTSPASSAPRSASGAPLRLRLSRVTARWNLRERIAFRSSERELGYYHTRRWTERPDAYLRHALARSLFERHGLTMVTSGSAPTLQVELTAFEELTEAPHRVRAAVTMILVDGNVARVHSTLKVEVDVPPVDKKRVPEAVAQAMSQALATLVEQIAERCIAELSAVEPAPTTPP